jgi:YesN/AraC family two-component response regulator
VLKKIIEDKRKDTLSFYRSNNFSLIQEREALEKLCVLDVKKCVECFSTIISKVISSRGDNFRSELFFLFDLLSKINFFIFRISGNQERYNENRASIIRRFSATDTKAKLKETSQVLLKEIVLSFDPKTLSSNSLVLKAKNYIEENYHHKLSLSRVAEVVNVSKNYLSTLFKNECHQTLTEYIHHVRMQKALFLLKSTNKTISEIAFQVGYQTYRDFYRNFVKHQKVSPKNYRRHLLKKKRT